MTAQVCFFQSFFGHTLKCFWNYRKKLSHFHQNIWKYRLKNTVTMSFNTKVRQVTKMTQEKKQARISTQKSQHKWEVATQKTTINKLAFPCGEVVSTDVSRSKEISRDAAVYICFFSDSFSVSSLQENNCFILPGMFQKIST